MFNRSIGNGLLVHGITTGDIAEVADGAYLTLNSSDNEEEEEEREEAEREEIRRQLIAENEHRAKYGKHKALINIQIDDFKRFNKALNELPIIAGSSKFVKPRLLPIIPHILSKTLFHKILESKFNAEEKSQLIKTLFTKYSYTLTRNVLADSILVNKLLQNNPNPLFRTYRAFLKYENSSVSEIPLAVHQDIFLSMANHGKGSSAEFSTVYQSMKSNSIFFTDTVYQSLKSFFFTDINRKLQLMLIVTWLNSMDNATTVWKFYNNTIKKLPHGNDSDIAKIVKQRLLHLDLAQKQNITDRSHEEKHQVADHKESKNISQFLCQNRSFFFRRTITTSGRIQRQIESGKLNEAEEAIVQEDEKLQYKLGF